MRKPLLPLDPTLRQRAIGVATRLMTEFTKGGKYRIPVAKYAQEICKIFRIPLLPKEAPVTVALIWVNRWSHLTDLTEILAVGRYKFFMHSGFTCLPI